MKETSAKEFKISFQFSFSQRNGFAQKGNGHYLSSRTIRLGLSESECRTLCTQNERYISETTMKYLTAEYRVKNTNMSIFKEAK